MISEADVFMESVPFEKNPAPFETGTSRQHVARTAEMRRTLNVSEADVVKQSVRSE